MLSSSPSFTMLPNGLCEVTELERRAVSRESSGSLKGRRFRDLDSLDGRWLQKVALKRSHGGTPPSVCETGRREEAEEASGVDLKR